MGNTQFIRDHLREGVILAKEREDFPGRLLDKLVEVDSSRAMIRALALSGTEDALSCVALIAARRDVGQLAVLALAGLPGIACGRYGHGFLQSGVT